MWSSGPPPNVWVRRLMVSNVGFGDFNSAPGFNSQRVPNHGLSLAGESSTLHLSLTQWPPAGLAMCSNLYILYKENKFFLRYIEEAKRDNARCAEVKVKVWNLYHKWLTNQIYIFNSFTNMVFFFVGIFIFISFATDWVRTHLYTETPIPFLMDTFFCGCTAP